MRSGERVAGRGADDGGTERRREGAESEGGGAGPACLRGAHGLRGRSPDEFRQPRTDSSLPDLGEAIERVGQVPDLGIDPSDHQKHLAMPLGQIRVMDDPFVMEHPVAELAQACSGEYTASQRARLSR